MVQRNTDKLKELFIIENVDCTTVALVAPVLALLTNICNTCIILLQVFITAVLLARHSEVN